MTIITFSLQCLSLSLLLFAKLAKGQFIMPSNLPEAFQDDWSKNYVEQLITGGFVDTTSCYAGLYEADENLDRKVDKEEYITFLQIFGPEDFLNETESFLDLPLILQSNFFLLACLCESRGEGDMCCVGDNTHIPNDGTAPGEEPTPDESSYLFLTCTLTNTSIERFVETLQPTKAPTWAPTELPSSPLPTVSPVARVTASPTSGPTTGPTIPPTIAETLGPTPDPTASPTPGPTPMVSVSPTRAPAVTPTTTPPTSAPTAGPTSAPTAGPTSAPTADPTSAPTGNPTAGLTQAPTRLGTRSPSQSPGPTAAPTGTPTGTPTDSPTASPTGAPTEPPIPPSPPPTTKPSSQDTQSPSVSLVPTTVPSPVPTGSPTITAMPSTRTGAPTTATIDVVGRTTYSISVVNGVRDDIPQSEYVPDLIGAMDIIAIEVAADVGDSLQGGRRLVVLLRRKLAIRVDLQTSVDAIIDAGGWTTDPDLNEDGIFVIGACPADLGNSETDRCEEVTASAGLFLSDENPLIVQQLFQSGLDRAIVDGRLQEALDEVNPNSVVAVLTGREATGDRGTPPPLTPQGEGLSPGATAGIAISALVLILLTILLVRRQQDDKPEEPELQPVPAAGLDWAEGEQKGDEEAGAAGVALVGASKPDYGKKKKDPRKGAVTQSTVPVVEPDKQPKERLAAVPAPYTPKKEEPGRGSPQSSQTPDPMKVTSSDLSPESPSSYTDAYSAGGRSSGKSAGDVSYENSSGWSSDVYASSMGTMESDEFMPGAQLVDLGVASGNMVENPGITNFDDLEAAITSGDWAAVGASAALLAATQYDSDNSKSNISRSSSFRSKSNSWKLALDAKKAAELDQLIEHGDWEGVIQAAAKFEAESNTEAQTSEVQSAGSSDSGSLPSSGGSSLPSSGYNPESGSAGSGTHPSMSTMSAMSDNNKRTQEEIRKEVLALVERVVPEEIDHVDEMMAQFKGREDELLETLRTMQERNIAQKARKAVQRQAKFEVSGRADRDDRRVAAIEAAEDRAQAMQSNPPPPAAAAAIFVAADATSADAITVGSTSAVANAESIISGPNSEEISPNVSGDSSGSERQRHREALYSAIDAGNWEAVGEAAAILSDTDESKFRATFESSRSGSTLETTLSFQDRRAELTELIENGDWMRVVASASRYSEADKQKPASLLGQSDAGTIREQQLREEEEAMRQAEVWMEIAKQSKTESGEEGTAAADAADWAIARSLSLLESKDKEQQEASEDADADDGDQESV